VTTLPPRSTVDDTHHPHLVSWVGSAQASATDFPIQNLPLGWATAGPAREHPCVAIGDQVLDLAALAEAGLLDDASAALAAASVAAGSLNPLLSAGRPALAALRRSLSRALRADTDEGRRAAALADGLLAPLAAAAPGVPARVGDYTDFYASVHHASNVGSMFRPDNPLLPNYKWIPIGYHGRASSIVASGSTIRRPSGQTRDDPAAPPVVGPSRRLDYELEVGAYIGAPTTLGEPITLAAAEQHVAGLCLVNDWSARDIQTWEYQPLGPFLSKSFATTVSPWIVTLDALAPFRVPAFVRDPADPAPLPYLFDPADRAEGGFDIQLEVCLTSRRMRDEGRAPMRLSLGRFTSMYWTLGQMIAHHASNGCNLRAGDLLASGTVSGPTADSRGCLLERTWRGTEPLDLPTGEVRRFLEDGDEVVMRGWCERDGRRRIGFGECRGVVTPAR
jgi:fumarylacetoacetase